MRLRSPPHSPNLLQSKRHRLPMLATTPVYRKWNISNRERRGIFPRLTQICKVGAVSERNDEIEKNCVLDEKRRTDCASVLKRNFGAIKRNRKKQGLRPPSRERNPRAQSHLNPENSLNAACAWPVSSWPLSWAFLAAFLASTSSGPAPSSLSSQASKAARAPNAAQLLESARSHPSLRLFLDR